jgi:hypothetical protein
MAAKTLAEKMKLKPGLRAAVIGAPQGYLGTLDPLPSGVSLSSTLDGQFDWVQVFVQNKAELDSLVTALVQALKPESLLWISFPKGSSKIQTDLTRDKGWEPLQAADLKWINLVSVDETWSAFCLRPYRPGESRRSWR